MSISIEEAKREIKKLGFDIDLENKICKESIEYFVDKDDLEGLIRYMSQIQNCGGYALEIPICIWPVKDYTFEEKVLRILELYPFVRLLSNSELKEDEYVVKYRAEEDGHHFIKIKDDEEIVEKNECNLPQKFNGWGRLQNSPEAVFAVVKQKYRDEKMEKLPQCNRNMFLNMNAYEYTEDDGYTDIITKEAKKPATFEKMLMEAFSNKKSSFVYNNKKFNLKVRTEDKDLIYVCDEKDILGTVCTDGETFIIELDEEKKNKIFGFQPNPPILLESEREAKTIIRGEQYDKFTR